MYLKYAINFDGGGHIRAAGCTIYDTYENAKNISIRRNI